MLPFHSGQISCKKRKMPLIKGTFQLACYKIQSCCKTSGKNPHEITYSRHPSITFNFHSKPKVLSCNSKPFTPALQKCDHCAPSKWPGTTTNLTFLPLKTLILCLLLFQVSASTRRIRSTRCSDDVKTSNNNDNVSLEKTSAMKRRSTKRHSVKRHLRNFAFQNDILYPFSCEEKNAMILEVFKTQLRGLWLEFSF